MAALTSAPEPQGAWWTYQEIGKASLSNQCRSCWTWHGKRGLCALLEQLMVPRASREKEKALGNSEPSPGIVSVTFPEDCVSEHGLSNNF